MTDSNDTSSISLQQARYMGDFFQMKINRNESLNEFFFPLSAMLDESASLMDVLVQQETLLHFPHLPTVYVTHLMRN